MKKHHLFAAILLALSVLLSGQQAGTIDGFWLGTLKVQSSELRLAVIISGSAGGHPVGILNSIDQGGAEVPLDEVLLSGDTLMVAAHNLGMNIRGVIDPANGTWVTVFKQGPATFPLTLNKVEQLPGMSRPQEPVPPFPYKTEEVTYRNAEAGITLAGTLTIPEGQGPFPAVILLTGSGPQDRNEELYGHKPFLVLADYLTRQGIAVLRSDDRGVGGSSGNFASATTGDFAQDALAGVDFLKGRDDYKFGRIGLAGHSEGGMVAPLAASGSGSVDFIVLMAAPGIPFRDIVLSQMKRSYEKIGMSSGEAELNIAWYRQVFALVSIGRSDQQVRDEMDRLFENLLEEDRTRMNKSKESMEAEAASFTSPWWRFAMQYDPVSTLAKVGCPVLAINGEKDTQVLAEENLAAIEKALREGGNGNCQVMELEGLNHLFQTAETGDELEYGRIEETFSPGAMEVIARWILKEGS